ncbi:helix-turn-helix domain-containing protein [Lapidilactobacillus mulanensis]|uniref:Helix-turn-helix domain-containing protein n=1 Tax=Lapidilactobacillus mulanensis TaxID=2485999 RepID=A0ABW4DKN3_9LACO|nr:helix-turn-helix domain-containing protein [Lapidilactobacillus mulanensis]
MQLFELLDKTEYRQIQILQIILKQRQPTPISLLAKQLNLARNTVRQDLAALQENIDQLDGRIVLQSGDTQTVSFSHAANFSLADVYWHYLQNSLKYQLLIYLFENQPVEMKPMIKNLSISASTVTRRIREINQLLANFELTTQNFQIVGSKLQIRHFFMQLYWFGRPNLVNDIAFDRPQWQQMFNDIRRQYGNVLTESGELKAMIYLAIAKQRLEFGHSITGDFAQELDTRLASAPESVQLSAKFLRDCFGQWGLEWTQTESKSLLLFLMSNYCFNVKSPVTSEIVLFSGASDPRVHECNRYVDQRLHHAFAKFELDPQLIHRLSLSVIKTHFRIAYFRGTIDVYQTNQLAEAFNEQLWQPEIDYLPNQKFGDFCQKMAMHVLTGLEIDPQKYADLRFELIGRYAMILHMIYRSIGIRLKIGCDFPFEDVVAETAIENVTRHFDNTFPYEIGIYNRSENYDVILTNQQGRYLQQNDARVFVIFGIEYEFDYPALNAYLKAAYLDKVTRFQPDFEIV